MTTKVYASYNGSQQGFTIRNAELVQSLYKNTNIDYSSVAAGSNNDLYLTSANNIYHFKTDGTLLNTMTFPDKGIIYTSVTVKGDKVYATYDGSQLGVTVRDLNLNQLSFFSTGVHASGIAAGPNNDLYVTAANHIFNYGVGGNLIKDMEFPISSIEYTDVTVLCDNVYASYKGSQQGFTVRDLGLDQTSYTNTGFDISSIAAGPSSNLYLTSANHIYNYNINGTLIQDMEFPISSINYTGVTVIFDTLT